jgi:hypothetical protein
MKYLLALGALPVALAWAFKPAPPPIKPKLVQTEGVTAARMDDTSFSLRWRPVGELPPAIEVHHAPRRVVVDSAGADQVVSPPATRLPPRRLRSRIVRLDICQRHNMRRVNYGRTWRCRR